MKLVKILNPRWTQGPQDVGILIGKELAEKIQNDAYDADGSLEFTKNGRYTRGDADRKQIIGKVFILIHPHERNNTPDRIRIWYYLETDFKILTTESAIISILDI